MTRVVAIILAAGKGERLGGPKALLAWPAAPALGAPGRPAAPSAASPSKAGPERPLAIAHAEARLAAESSRALVVVRKQVMGPLLRFVQPGLDLLLSKEADELGPAGSLAVATARLGDAEAAVITPVDAPPARADTVARLLARLSADPALLAVRPRHKGRGGHPVVVRPEALQRYLAPNPPPLRDHLKALGERCAAEDVDDAAVLLDINTPVDVLRALGGPARFIT